jgi:hypothetical protein
MPQQAGLDMFGLQWFAQQRVVQQVDLPDRQVIRRSPIRVDQFQLLPSAGPTRGRVRAWHSVTPHQADDRAPLSRFPDTWQRSDDAQLQMIRS